MKIIFLSLLALCLAMITGAQPSAVNYTFSTTTSGSLVDMSSGTTQLIAADQDDIASAVTNLPFDFFLQGTRYGQFSVNSNGSIRLGTIAIPTTAYNPLAQPAQGLIAPYGTDQRSHIGDGKVHFKLTGTAPYRILVIEWVNMQANFSTGGTADLTYQAKLYETTGAIEFVYGSMAMSAAGEVDANSASPQIGFSSSNTINNIGTVTAAQSGTPAPTYNGSTATVVNNNYVAGTIPALSSAIDGSRRTFSFTPAIPGDPTGLSFTGVTVTSTTLNWIDNATNEAGYAIYRSSDGINYNFISQVGINATSSVQTGLFSGILYYWKVLAFTEGGISNTINGSQATLVAGVITSNGTGGGLWNTPATWAGGVVPTINDMVTIKDGDLVTIDASVSVYSLIVGEGSSGVLQFEATTARTLTVYVDATISVNGTFQSNATGTQTGHSLSVAGNLTNNGTLDFSTNAGTAGAGITFTGASNNTFGGSGAVTDIRQLTINKGTSNANVLELNPANFSVRESVLDIVVGGFLILTNGTLKISGSFTYTGRVFATAAYTIAATTGMWLNNTNFIIAGQNGIVTNNGVLRVTNGTWNLGAALSNSVAAGIGASFIIEGGILNVAGRMSPTNVITYTQSGGTVNISTVGNSGSGTASASFGIPQTTSTFTMSGGTINLIRASTGATPVDWYVPGNIIYTGGTLVVGSSATATNFNFRIRGSIPALVIDNTTNNKTATFAAQVNSFGNVTINPGTTVVTNGFLWLVIGPLVTNNGTITGTTANSRFYFQGLAPQTYSGSGVANVQLLDIDNVSGLTVDPLSAGINATLRINVFNGGITNANKITLGLGAATSATIQFGVGGSTLAPGNLDVSPVFNVGTGGLFLIYYSETTARTTGAEINSSRILAGLTVSNPNGINIAGGDLTISAGTTPTLTMITGNITTGSNILTLGASAALPGVYVYTTGTIVGKFKRWIGTAGGNTDFPVGIAATKRMASINFTTPPSIGGTLTTQWVSAIGGGNGLPLVEGTLNVSTCSSNGFWSVVAGDGLTGGAYTGTFSPTGIGEVTDVTKLVLIKRADASSPWTLDGTHVTGSGTPGAPVISRTNLSGFSEFGIGSDAFFTLPVSLTTFSGQRTGSANILHWTTANEENNLGFEVQRSTNGVTYSTLGFVNSLATGGNSINTLNYYFTDNNPGSNIQYYRLRQVDIDNRSKYSNVILIRGEKPTTLMIAGLYPNPVTSVVNIEIASPVNTKLVMTITDINGRLVNQHTASIETGSNSIPVDISRLPGGVYIVKLVSIGNPASTVVTRFVKK